MSEFLSPDPKLLTITISNISFQSLLLQFLYCMAFIAGQCYSSEYQAKLGCVSHPGVIHQIVSILTYSDCRQDSPHLPLAR